MKNRLLAVTTDVPWIDELIDWIETTVGADNVTSVNIYGNTTVAGEAYGATVIDKAGKSYAVSESHPYGVTTVTPQQAQLGAAGGAGSFVMTTSEGLSPTLASDAPWLTAVLDATNPLQVNYTVQANAEPIARQGVITCAGEPGQSSATFFVSQAAGATPSA